MPGHFSQIAALLPQQEIHNFRNGVCDKLISGIDLQVMDFHFLHDITLHVKEFLVNETQVLNQSVQHISEVIIRRVK